ncbi:hypothetical protein WJX84_005180 [Apatococcus fuscideae]|uniref:catalase n=1 Tax=Apatococcus fuscideae TaxID=2026836 RepID=A0AAW1T814_9CHLO
MTRHLQQATICLPHTATAMPLQTYTIRLQAGEAAEWSFHIQTIDPEDQEKFEFDPLDDTKVWPEDRFPLQPVGKMILDTNVTNFHNESESIAFAPGIFVAGEHLILATRINGSNDRLLQSRMHAYADAQRYRIGDNYLLLPINQPKCPYHNNHNEGLMNFMIKDEEVNYWPSHVEHTNEHNAVKTTDLSHKIAGVRTREDIPKTNDFQQGGDRYRNLIAKDEKRKERFIGHIVSWMTEPKCNEKIRNLWYSHWKNVDADLGKIVEERVKAATSK